MSKSHALKRPVRGAIYGTLLNTRSDVMTNVVLSEMTASVSELKKNPMGTVAAGEGAAVAILNRNEPAFYCVPAEAYEALLERLEDIELNALAEERKNDAVVMVDLDEL